MGMRPVAICVFAAYIHRMEALSQRCGADVDGKISDCRRGSNSRNGNSKTNSRIGVNEIFDLRNVNRGKWDHIKTAEMRVSPLTVQRFRAHIHGMEARSESAYI